MSANWLRAEGDFPGLASPQCDRARHLHGMTPLTPESWIGISPDVAGDVLIEPVPVIVAGNVARSEFGANQLP